MSLRGGIIRALSTGAATACLVSQALAAVVILDGASPPPSPAPALAAPEAPPAAAAPQGSGPAVAEPPVEMTPTPPAISAPPPPQPVAPSPEKGGAAALDLSRAAPANPAEVSIEMLPGQTVSVGSTVSFKVRSKKPGYLVLVDVDATGHLTQIYPNTASLTRTSRANANYVKPGSPFTIPLATDPYAGVRYVVSPPNGRAMIVAILSALPVQILDLPDIPADLIDKPDKILSFLSKRAGELRIPDSDNQLREAHWSFDAKPYVIQ